MNAWSKERSRIVRDVDAACDFVRDGLGRGQFVPIEAEVLGSPDRRLKTPLAEAEPGGLRAGTKPLSILLDPEGRTYVLKKAEPALMAAEEAAWDLLQLGGRPGVPARRALVTLVDGTEVDGVLKPYVDLSAKDELPPDTRRWTELQRAVMLVSHVWEHVLDNLDTNTSQYALLGPEDVPVNIDWDRSFASEGRSELSRFAKHKRILPNARTFLYADFVEGRVKLPLGLLSREARRIRRLPVSDVRRLLERYARVAYTDDVAAASFVERMIDRYRSVENDVDRFIYDLRAERARLQSSVTAWPERVWRMATLWWDRWQLTLHRLFRGPLGSAARKVLKQLRTKNA